MSLDLLMKLPRFYARIIKEKPLDLNEEKNLLNPNSSCLPLSSTEEQIFTHISLILCSVFKSFNVSLEGFSDLQLDDARIQPLLAENISMLLDFIAKPWSFPALELDALKALAELIRQMDGYPDRIAQFMPGILSCAASLILKGKNVNHKLIVASLDLISLLVVGCCSDKDCPFLDNTLQQQQQDNFKMKEESILLKRDLKWLQETESNLALVFSKLVALKSCTKSQVAFSITNLSWSILKSCTRALGKCNVELCRALLYSSFTDDDKLAQFSRDAIEDLGKSGWFQVLLLDSLEDLLLSECDPRRDVLVLLACHVDCLGQDCAVIIENNLEKITCKLLWVLEPELEKVQLLQETKTISISNTTAWKQVGFPKIEFKKMQDESLLSALKSLVSAITRVCPFLFAQHLSSLLEASGDSKVVYRRFAILYLMNLYLECTPNEVYSFCEMFLEQVNVSLSTTNTKRVNKYGPETPSSLSISERNLEIVTKSTIFQGLALACRKLERQEQSLLMMQSLYVVLEGLGHSNYTIQSSAYTCLQEFATCMDLKSVSGLIMENSDYLVDAVSLKLRYALSNPMAPRVLRAAIHLSGPKLVSTLTDVVDQVLDILATLGSGNSSVLVMDCLLVLDALVCTFDSRPLLLLDDDVVVAFDCSVEMRAFLKRLELDVINPDPNGNNVDDVEDAKTFFTKYHDNDQVDQDQDQEEKVKQELSQEQKLGLEISERIVYFISSDSPRIRSLVLDILAKFTPLLSNLPTKINPLIHLIWPKLVGRLRDPVPFVVLKAFELCRVFCLASSDFMRVRIEKDAISCLLSRLSSLLPSKNLISQNLIRSRGELELARAVLSSLEAIAKVVVVSRKQASLLIPLLIDLYRVFAVKFAVGSDSNDVDGPKRTIYRVLLALLENHADIVWIYTHCLIMDFPEFSDLLV